MPSIPASPSSSAANDPTRVQVREIKPNERVTHLHDGKDQIQVRGTTTGKSYVIEGESLRLEGLKAGKLPVSPVKIDGIDEPVTVTHVDNEAQGFGESLRQAFSLPPGWGKPSQIAGTVDELLDLKGNKDGIWHNESQPKGTLGSALDRNPLALKALAHEEGKYLAKYQIEALTQFRMGQEDKWGEPVTRLDITQLKDGELFAAQKAIALTRMERTPSEVTDGFVRAAGKVNGHQIPEREVFYQRFKPVGEPSGKMVVMFPGFLQTGRNFYEQVQLLNKQGHDVIVMDQQWAGQTKGGKDGGVDRGYGITRDVAAVAAYAQTQLDADYKNHPGKELILMGTSLGGGPGVIGALTMSENNKLELEGPPMPKQVKAVLQGPFLGATDNLGNKVANAASRLPGINQVPLPTIGIPILSTDKEALQKIAQGAVMEDLQARLQAMTGVNKDTDEIMQMIAEGKGPKVPIEIIHSKGDPLASSDKSKWLAAKLPHAHVQLLNRNDHVLEQQRDEQVEALKALERLK